MKQMPNENSLPRQLLLILGGALQLLATLTVVSNFGWAHDLSFLFYGITTTIFFVIYLLWKN